MVFHHRAEPVLEIVLEMLMFLEWQCQLRFSSSRRRSQRPEGRPCLGCKGLEIAGKMLALGTACWVPIIAGWPEASHFASVSIGFLVGPQQL